MTQTPRAGCWRSRFCWRAGRARPDGSRIATASRDGTARLWDAVTGGEIARITLDAGVAALAVSSGAIALGDGLGAFTCLILRIPDRGGISAWLRQKTPSSQCSNFISLPPRKSVVGARRQCVDAERQQRDRRALWLFAKRQGRCAHRPENHLAPGDSRCGRARLRRMDRAARIISKLNRAKFAVLQEIEADLPSALQNVSGKSTGSATGARSRPSRQRSPSASSCSTLPC